MKQLSEDESYDLTEWRKYNAFEMMYNVYVWGNLVCEQVTNTKNAKELLKIVRNIKFDVIVQDVTLVQCLYGLWEVYKSYFSNELQYNILSIVISTNRKSFFISYNIWK